MGEEGVPTVEEFIQDQLPEGGCLGFDGRVVNRNLGLKLEKAVNSHGGKLSVAEDLVGRIWTDRPSLPAEPVFILEERYSGKSMEDKVDEVRKAMEEEGAQAHILTSLDDIAWLLNIRGGDIPNFPIVLSYVVLTPEKLFLFINPATLSEKVRAYLEDVYKRQAPAWVARSFCRPGRRLKLHPDDYFVLGTRGGIDERWFASTTWAENGPGTPEDCLLYTSGKPFG